MNVHLILNDIGDGGTDVTNRLKIAANKSVYVHVRMCVPQITVAQQANRRRFSESCHDSWLNCLRLLSFRCTVSNVYVAQMCYIGYYLYLFRLFIHFSFSPTVVCLFHLSQFFFVPNAINTRNNYILCV